MGEKCHTTARVVGVVLLEVERPLVWRCGVSAPAFTSQLSALELRPEWWLPRAGSGPGQVAEGLQVVSYGLLLPNQRARAGHRRTLGTHVVPFWDTLGLGCRHWDFSFLN